MYIDNVDLELSTKLTNQLTNVLDDIEKVSEARGVFIRGRKRYTIVADRVVALRRSFGLDFSIETEVIDYNKELPNGINVIVKASIYYFNRLIATGHAAEIWNKSDVNKTSALENAETSAIGRALASLGIHGGEFASANELDAVQRKEEISSIDLDEPKKVVEEDKSAFFVPQNLSSATIIPPLTSPEDLKKFGTSVLELIGKEDVNYAMARIFYRNNTPNMEKLGEVDKELLDKITQTIKGKKNAQV